MVINASDHYALITDKSCKDVNISVFDINFGEIAYDRPYFNIDDSSADK